MDKHKPKRPRFKKGGKRKGKQRHGKPKGIPGMGRPTLVLKGRYTINQNISGINLKQINIIPTLSTLGLDILKEASYF